MIKIEHVDIHGWPAAIRGMRNPKNSWTSSDSEDDQIGPNDLRLMTSLRNAGSDHRKFMRFIFVTCDVIAPLYWWKEFDTYKVGTVANSCSTMHKIHDKIFERSDFSYEQLNANWDAKEEDAFIYWPSINCPLESEPIAPLEGLDILIQILNHARQAFLLSGDKRFWWQMIQLLPTSYNQKRTIALNYEVLANIYKARHKHKLDEWLIFCDWITTLPQSQLITNKEFVEITKMQYPQW